MSSDASPTIRVPVTCAVPHVVRTLPNGAQVIIVTDPEAKKPAAAMSIAVGSHNDPADFPGLAHFCEHMLFMGTAQFPSEDAYENAVARSGGHTNAWTAADTTTYYFKSSLDSFHAIVDMFLHFFVAPSFSPSAVSRELNAVHSEDEKNHTIDFWRIDELFRTLANPDHPRSRYGNGNRTTLLEEPEAKGLRVHDALLAFYKKNYVASAACLAIHSPLSPDEVMAFVAPVLGQMQAGPRAEQRFVPRGEALLPSAHGQWFNVLTTKKERKVRVGWVLPFGHTHFRRCPYAWLSHVLGHEAQGSVIAYLRAKGLATDLVGGSGGAIDDDHTFVYVSITLTDAGFAAVDSVVATVFQFLAALRAGGIVPEDSYDEFKAEHLLRFEFTELGSPENHCTRLTGQALAYGAENAFCGDSIVHEDARAESFAVLEHVTADKAFFVLQVGDATVLTDAATAAPATFRGQAALDKETRFHKMPYSVAQVPAALLQSWAEAAPVPGLAVPKPNPFIATDFTVYNPPGSTPYPERLPMKYGYALVKRNEAHLAVPKSSLIINLLSVHGAANALSAVFLKVACSAANEALAETLYYAELVGVDFHINPTACGLLLAVNGPSAVIGRVALLVLDSLLHASFLQQDAARIQTHMTKAVCGLQGSAEEQPLYLGYGLMGDFLASDAIFWWPAKLAAAADATAASYDAYCAFIAAFVSQLRVELAFVGNVPTVAHVKAELLDAIDDRLAASGAVPCAADALPPVRNLYVPRATGNQTMPLIIHGAFNGTNANAATVVRISLGDVSDPAAAVRCQVLGNILSSPFFNTLRSTEALGYMVSARVSVDYHRAASLSFAAQSAEVGPLYLYSRIIAFIDAFEAQILAALPQADVDGVCRSLITSYKALTTSVKNDAQRVFGDRLHPGGFEHRQAAIAAIEAGVPADALRELFAKRVSNASATRDAITVMIHPGGATAESAVRADGTPVLLPTQREQPATESAVSSPSDIRLVMNTFAAPTHVTFAAVASKAEAHAISDEIVIPFA